MVALPPTAGTSTANTTRLTSSAGVPAAVGCACAVVGVGVGVGVGSKVARSGVTHALRSDATECGANNG